MSGIEKNFGRPKDIEQEIKFMEKLRDNKLQVIIANCELELCLTSFENQPEKSRNTRRKRRKAKTEESEHEDNSLLINEHQILSLKLPDFSIELMEKMYQQFKEIIKNWEYVNISEEEELPEYLFESEVDLSYILNSLMKNFGYTSFSPSQLLYLELLIIEQNKMMTMKVFEDYKKNLHYLIAAIKEGLKKLLIKKNELLEKKQKKVDKDMSIDIQEVENYYVDEIQSQKQDESEQRKKSKKVVKKRRKKSNLLLKRKKINKASHKDKESDGSIDIDDEISYPEGKKLSLITANYIIWAYWYIYPKVN